MDDQNQPVAPAPIYQETQEKNAKWLWLLIILIIVGALVFAFFKGIGPFAAISPFAKTEATPTPSPISQVDSTFENASPSPTEDVDRSGVKLRVLNGSGVTGKASSTKDFLENLGWTVASIGNADGSDYSSTEVRFKSSAKDYEVTIIEDLSEKFSASASNDDLEASGSADIEVIVGSK